MVDYKPDTFEPLTGETFTLLAFGGKDEEGNEHPPAEIPITLEKVTKEEPICYPDVYERDDKGGLKVDKNGKKIVAKKGEPVPDLPVPFALVFHAPDHTPISDGAYTITHKTLGSMEDINVSRDIATTDGKVKCVHENRQVEVDGKVVDHDCCTLRVQFA